VDVGCEIGRETAKARNARKVKLTTETQRKNCGFGIADCGFKNKKTELTADGRGRTQTKIFTTEAQQGDAEMGRDGDTARKAKKN
jgi:hypothetical protein